MSPRVEVRPKLLRWACSRCGVPVGAFSGRFPKLSSWIDGTARPTLKQLENFARATHTPIGYLFLAEPPIERVPIPDMRTPGSWRVKSPSPDLLETIYLCQQRQEWYRNFARSTMEAPCGFVGTLRCSDDVVRSAAAMRAALAFDIQEQQRLSSWTDALRRFIEKVEALGILVMVSGVVGSNNRRVLDPEEFRGFAMADDLAPLVFINGADSKAAQMFTLAHELAHLWLGDSALSNVGPAGVSSKSAETWCNRVAAELLVPLAALLAEYDARAPLRAEVDRLARYFKVSTLVILRRVHDAGGLHLDQFRIEYRAEVARLLGLRKKMGGGDFYLTQAARVGKRFARALLVSTLQGQTLHRDALRMLCITKLTTFHDLGHRLGML